MSDQNAVFDFYQAGGRSLVYFVELTGRSVNLNKLLLHELKTIVVFLGYKVEGLTKKELISIIKNENL